MALDPPFVVRVEKQPQGSFGETMSLIRSWLDHRHIQPTSFQSVADAQSGVGLRSASTARMRHTFSRRPFAPEPRPPTHRQAAAANVPLAANR